MRLHFASFARSVETGPSSNGRTLVFGTSYVGFESCWPSQFRKKLNPSSRGVRYFYSLTMSSRFYRQDPICEIIVLYLAPLHGSGGFMLFIEEGESRSAQAKHISGHTHLISLLGTPIRHSASPVTHSVSFELTGIDAVYLAFEATRTICPTSFQPCVAWAVGMVAT